MTQVLFVGLAIGVCFALAFIAGCVLGAVFSRDARSRSSPRVKSIRLPLSEPLETIERRGTEHPSGPPPPPPGSTTARNWAARFTGGVR